ncbi:alginate lyase family protein [Isoptericola sp. NPDC056605]|uniref:alginate lyase family protein n=1 Tax=Isoptericola sp. NPDC056605 TaxID=3345876 RepID=UPI0036AF261A
MGLSAVLLLSLAAPSALAAPLESTHTEDFANGLDDWTVESGRWTAEDGAARVDGETLTGPRAMHLTRWQFGDSATTVNVRATDAADSNSWVGLSTRMTAGQEDFRQSGYTAFLRMNGQLALVKPHASDPTAVSTIATASTGIDPRKAPVSLTLRAEGSSLEVFVDGATEPAISTTDTQFTRGKVGLVVGAAFATFDDVRISHDDGVEEEPPPAAGTDWGGVFLGEAKLAELRDRVTRNPQDIAWQDVLAQAERAVSRDAQAPEIWEVPPFYAGADANRAAKHALLDDANQAYAAGIAYSVTGEEVYAEAAAKMIRAWSHVQEVRTTEDSGLTFSYHFPAMIFAADLIDDYDGFSAGDRAAFTAFLRGGSLNANTMDRTNNWGNWGMVLVIATAAYLEDEALFQTAVHRWKYFVEHQIDADGTLPLEISRNDGTGSHGIWYTHFTLQPQTIAAEIALVNGVDLYDYRSPSGRSLRQAYEAVSGWVAEPETFPVWQGDPSGMTNVRTIEYVFDGRQVRESTVSYFEILNAHWPSEAADSVLVADRPVSTLHTSPYLTFTHGPAVVEQDTSGPVISVKPGSQGRDGVFGHVAFRFHDEGFVDKLILNGTERDLVDDVWSDLDGVAPGVSGGRAGDNELSVLDVAGNVTTMRFVLDDAPPTVTVKDESVAAPGGFSSVSFKVFDAYRVDRVVVNGKPKDLADNPWSDVNQVEPGAFGAVLGANTLEVFDVAGNVTRSEFTLVAPGSRASAPVVVTDQEGAGSSRSR